MSCITINLRGMYSCNKLFARKVWEQLFRLEHAENWKTLDNFLIDYELFAKKIEEAYLSKDEILVFYWCFYDKTGWTKVISEEQDYLVEKPCYKIEVDLKSQRILLERISE